MPDLQRGSQSQKDKGDQVYLSAVNALRREVEKVSKKVREIEGHLSETYPKDGLLSLSRQFESISKEFTNFTEIRNNAYYEIIRRSRDRLSFTKAVASEARKLALLFENYSKNPKTYRASNSRIQINRLQAQLENLRAACSSGTVQ